MPSTVIRDFHYHADQRRLEILFQMGRRYSYFDVPADVFAAMKDAASKGEFFNAHIRDEFRFAREGSKLR
jgi:hypothetical protein